jgi:hypothetical protein
MLRPLDLLVLAVVMAAGIWLGRWALLAGLRGLREGRIYYRPTRTMLHGKEAKEHARYTLVCGLLVLSMTAALLVLVVLLLWRNGLR